MANIWMVRAGSGAENVEEFKARGVVALADENLGQLAPSMKKEDILRLYAEKNPNSVKEGDRQIRASQFLRLLSEIKIGDTIVTFDRDSRLYFLGTVTSEYEWAPKLIKDKPHCRKVGWSHQVQRDLLTESARNILSVRHALFKISPEVTKELQEHKVPIGAAIIDVPSPSISVAGGVDSEGSDVRAEILEKADEFIEDAINRLDWKQMQSLVAGILRAMGYRTTVSGPGADRGVDIFASPDGLGLQEPRIFVEVKHRYGTMGAEKIRAFLGGRKIGDKCLYVSTGSFSKDARYEAERASVPTTLIDLTDLRRLLVENYEKLDGETRALVPLKRFYWPIA